jgi:hypothetical protein
LSTPIPEFIATQTEEHLATCAGCSALARQILGLGSLIQSHRAEAHGIESFDSDACNGAFCIRLAA